MIALAAHSLVRVLTVASVLVSVVLLFALWSLTQYLDHEA